MKKNIILCGVGGQGIITLSKIIANACANKRLNVTESEIHGMSLRGGSVYSHIRISDSKIYSSLIPIGKADIILSLELCETINYLKYLSKKGVAIVSSEKKNKVSNLHIQKIFSELRGYTHKTIDVKDIAKKENIVGTQNIILLGVITNYLPSFEESFRKQIYKIFKHKGKRILTMNLRAFDTGVKLEHGTSNNPEC
jgi:indolepyruvate ferredoxin oxidoreductase beta subunit